MKDYIIIANGPFLVKEIILEAIQKKQIVALDGAANQLMRLQIKPDVIIGDLDSIEDKTRHYFQSLNVTIVHDPSQAETDLIKGIRYCDARGATHISLICAAGGREDHHEGVKMALRTEYQTGRQIILHSTHQSICAAQDEMVIIVGEPGDYCGVIATDTGVCTSRGLKYECDQHNNSICNRLLETQATLTINGFAYVIMPPQLQMQRQFALKSEKEQLEMRLRDLSAQELDFYV